MSKGTETPFPDVLIQTNGCCFTNIQCFPWLKRICSQKLASGLAVLILQPTLRCLEILK